MLMNLLKLAMVRSVPRKELQEQSDNPFEESDNLKLLYIKDFVDEAGFVTIQIKRFTLKGETVALIVYGKHMSGVGQVFRTSNQPSFLSAPHYC